MKNRKMKLFTACTLAAVMTASLAGGVSVFADDFNTKDVDVGSVEEESPLGGTEVGSEEIEVKGVYVEESQRNQELYYAFTLDWGTMEFTYVGAPQVYRWNPKTHRYDAPDETAEPTENETTELGWQTAEFYDLDSEDDPLNNFIGVINHSNMDVDVSLNYEAETNSGFDNVTGSFYFFEEDQREEGDSPLKKTNLDGKKTLKFIEVPDDVPEEFVKSPNYSNFIFESAYNEGAAMDFFLQLSGEPDASQITEKNKLGKIGTITVSITTPVKAV